MPHLDIAHIDARYPKLHLNRPYPLFRMHASMTMHNWCQTLDGTLGLHILLTNTVFLIVVKWF